MVFFIKIIFISMIIIHEFYNLIIRTKVRLALNLDMVRYLDFYQILILKNSKITKLYGKIYYCSSDSYKQELGNRVEYIIIFDRNPNNVKILKYLLLGTVCLHFERWNVIMYYPFHSRSIEKCYQMCTLYILCYGIPKYRILL